MALFTAEARRRLGTATATATATGTATTAATATNEDHGLIAYGLAVLGWPLSEAWVQVRVRVRVRVLVCRLFDKPPIPSTPMLTALAAPAASPPPPMWACGVARAAAAWSGLTGSSMRAAPGSAALHLGALSPLERMYTFTCTHTGTRTLHRVTHEVLRVSFPCAHDHAHTHRSWRRAGTEPWLVPAARVWRCCCGASVPAAGAPPVVGSGTPCSGANHMHTRVCVPH